MWRDRWRSRKEFVKAQSEWGLTAVINERGSDIPSKKCSPVLGIIPTACAAFRGCRVGIWVSPGESSASVSAVWTCLWNGPLVVVSTSWTSYITHSHGGPGWAVHADDDIIFSYRLTVTSFPRREICTFIHLVFSSRADHLFSFLFAADCVTFVTLSHNMLTKQFSGNNPGKLTHFSISYICRSANFFLCTINLTTLFCPHTLLREHPSADEWISALSNYSCYYQLLNNIKLKINSNAFYSLLTHSSKSCQSRHSI